MTSPVIADAGIRLGRCRLDRPGAPARDASDRARTARRERSRSAHGFAVRCGVLVSLWFALAAGPAAAAPTWLAPVQVSNPAVHTSSEWHGSVAVAPDGTVWFAYTQESRGPLGPPTGVNVAVRQPSGSFTWERIENGSQPSIDVDAQGNATLAYIKEPEGDQVMVTTAAAPGGSAPTWSAPSPLTASGAYVGSLRLDVGARGNAIVAWARVVDGFGDCGVNPCASHAVAQASYRASGARDFEVPGTTLPSSSFRDSLPTFAAVPNGGRSETAMVGWTMSNELAYNVEVSAFEQGNGYSAPVLIDASGRAGELSGVVDDGGRATVVYPGSGGQGKLVLRSSTRSLDEPLSAFVSSSQTISPPGENVGTATSSPQIAAAGDGALTAVWLNEAQTLKSAVRPAGSGTWTGSPDIATGASAPALAADAAGGFGVVWLDGALNRVEAARRSAGATAFGGVEVLGDSGGPFDVSDGAQGVSPSLAFDAQGNAAAGWNRKLGAGDHAPTVAGLDAAPPVLLSASIPDAGLVGEPLPFGAMAVDVWSPVSFAWEFGDGATGAGGSPSHTFTSAGSYGVKVTASDALGNVAPPAQRNVTVARKAPVVVPPVDADGDGVSPPADCNDRDAAIKPGAREIRGNRVDEDCDGRASPYLSVLGSATLIFSKPGGRSARWTRVRKLIATDVTRGATLRVSCRGRGCRRSLGRRGKPDRRGQATFGLGAVKLSPGASLTLRISRPGYVTRIFTWVMRSYSDPPKRRYCMSPGAAKPRRC